MMMINKTLVCLLIAFFGMQPDVSYAMERSNIRSAAHPIAGYVAMANEQEANARAEIEKLPTELAVLKKERNNQLVWGLGLLGTAGAVFFAHIFYPDNVKPAIVFPALAGGYQIFKVLETCAKIQAHECAIDSHRSHGYLK